MAIHPVSGYLTFELGHHVHLRRDEHRKHYHLDHLDRLSNCSTWTPAPVSHSHNDAKGRQEVSPHCHDGSCHPQQSPNIERHPVAPHTRCIGTSDSTSHITNTHVVKCQATQTTTANIVANDLNKQSSQATVQRVLYCFTCGGRGHNHVVARHLGKRVSHVEAMVMQPLTVLTVTHCHGNKDVVGGDYCPGTPGSTSGGGCGHLLLGCSNHRKPTYRLRRLRRKPKTRERGEHYSSVAVNLRVTQDNITNLHGGKRQ
ncbi:hypothetical protein NP493_6132g00005 [Ridgeia piscesae]|uniref:Uncharacterized protein n=1 Tax=Ridgeia piscesae TaxID=27915 RepID=A0AAD9MQD2_RIDPI|nr:hypothetical protein NP493_6132g00005 [Ridgeia piscesae]